MKKIKLYTKNYCGYCNWAKRALRDGGYEFEFEEIQNKPAVQDELIARTGQTTVPYVFVGDELIGGCDDMLALMNTGRFDALLQE